MNDEPLVLTPVEPPVVAGPVEVLPPALPAAPVELVDLIATAVRACPAVAALHGGRFGQATTYLPGRRVSGVALAPTEIVVGVVGRYPTPVAELAGQVRAAVGLLVPGMPVTVNVEDLALPGELVETAGPGIDPVPVRPPLATPLAPPEKEHLS